MQECLPTYKILLKKGLTECGTHLRQSVVHGICTWDLWWMKWHWGQVLLPLLPCFSTDNSIPPFCALNTTSNTKSCTVSATDSGVQTTSLHARTILLYFVMSHAGKNLKFVYVKNLVLRLWMSGATRLLLLYASVLSTGMILLVVMWNGIFKKIITVSLTLHKRVNYVL